MTRKEAKSCIGTIEMLQRLAYNIHGVMDVIDVDNCKKIIESLEQEPCEDAVSRTDVLELIEDINDTVFGQVVSKGVMNLPSVNQQKTGHWSHDGSHWKNRFICSECGYKLFDEPTNYCPNCGCRMVEPQESEG